MKFSILISLLVLITVSCRDSEKFYSNVLRSDVRVQEYEDRRYDFLWVFDNSGSMQSRRDFVRDNLQTFLSTLNSRKAIDYQMAAVTTDMFTHEGNLVESATGTSVVKSATTANPVAAFAGVINAITDSPTSFWEQGLEASYQAIFKHGSEFSRPGVPLMIVYLTDEEDYSCKDDCYGSEPENNLNWKPYSIGHYIDYFKQVKKNEDSEVVLFPIVGLSQTACEVASLGSRYVDVQAAIGLYGKSASICNSDLKESYNGIAKVIADRGSVFTLSTKASGSGIHVWVDQVEVPFAPENFIFDESQNAVIFTGYAPKKGSVIEFVYAEKVQ